jgi:WhiB family redox-sensing transcriptional regulator
MNSAEVEWLMFPLPPEVEVVLRRPAWHAEASCRGNGFDAFFPDSHDDSRNVIGICTKCTVRTQCLNYALEDPSLTGIWGGTSARRRRRLRRQAC